MTESITQEPTMSPAATVATLFPRGTAQAPWRIGTRGSVLAMTQAGTVRDALVAAGQHAELVVVSTAGDRSAAAVQEIGVGVFTTALRDELAVGAIDVAVHSYKDLPTAPDERLVIAAVAAREDPRDALVARDGLTLDALPRGARVGTSAPRRVAQLRALGLGLELIALRGNLDTRLRKVAQGQLDAVVVAQAGLARLGRLAEVTTVLDPAQVLPAPAQGALAVECRRDNPELVALLNALDDARTRAAVVAERTVLAELEAGCVAPVGALAEVDEASGQLSLQGCVAALDGSTVLRATVVGPCTDAQQLGRQLARDLVASGAADLLGAPRSASAAVGNPTARESRL